MPTLYGIKPGEKLLKGVQKCNFWNLVIFSLKTKEEPKDKLFISNFDLL
jgi:hypothetical protein